MGKPKSEYYVPTLRDKRSPYFQYYFGEKDQLEQRNGIGENHWTGAESLEWYTGSFLHDTMHGEGEYRWRFKDPDGAFITYEGWFYANKLHGYGVMSYANGNVFTGLYYNDVRWGPGVEQMPSLQSNVGLWRGIHLARLAWTPDPRSVAPDLATGPAGPAYLNPFRVILMEHLEKVCDNISAINVMRDAGADPVLANEVWPKLYPLTCGDPASALFHKALFDYKYYKDKKYTLKELSGDNLTDFEPSKSDHVTGYFAWNNNEMMVHMMKHAFQHDKQRSKVKLSLPNILTGPRKRYRPAGKHELDCRTVLMASFLGHVESVAPLVNESDVYADIADKHGNTALMYAVCGDKRKIIKFLVGAGANVNCCNDSCCTPLGVALLRYIGIAQDIPHSRLLQAVLPPFEKEAKETTKPDEEELLQKPIVPVEWNMPRELTPNTAAQKIRRPSLKSVHESTSRLSILKQISAPVIKVPELETNYESDDYDITEEKRLFVTINTQYVRKISEMYPKSPDKTETKYLFTVNDLFAADNPIAQILKERSRTNKSHQSLWENHAKDVTSLDSSEKHVHDMLTEIELTIIDLLELGSDPKLVVCPQPAVLLALKTRNPDIVRQMVSHGANINQKFPELNNYTLLDMVTTDEDICVENLAMLKTLLEIGAGTTHRLPVPQELVIPSDSVVLQTETEEGPTLLHAILKKTSEFEDQEDILERMLRLLLVYNCDPAAQYMGSSAIDTAMNNQQFALLNIIIKNPSTDLNAIINSNNQTMLMKLFSRQYCRETTPSDRVSVLTNLLLYGADPLIECYNENDKYENIFEFANSTYKEIGKEDPQKQPDKKGKPPATAVTDIKPKGAEESLDLITECARMIHVRWIQGKLARGLIDVIHKFNHRPWQTIIREVQNGYVLGLWLNTLRCLEIWDVLKSTRKKKYNDRNILKKFVSIIQFYTKRVHAKINVAKRLTAAESNVIDSDVIFLLKEHKIAAQLCEEVGAWKMIYLKPELDIKGEHKFHVCFECALRLRESYLTCDFCHLVSFCDMGCLRENVERLTNHPCNEFLIEKYFPPQEDNSVWSLDIISRSHLPSTL